jgi:hypothetical protein
VTPPPPGTALLTTTSFLQPGDRLGDRHAEGESEGDGTGRARGGADLARGMQSDLYVTGVELGPLVLGMEQQPQTEGVGVEADGTLQVRNVDRDDAGPNHPGSVDRGGDASKAPVLPQAGAAELAEPVPGAFGELEMAPPRWRWMSPRCCRGDDGGRGANVACLS